MKLNRLYVALALLVLVIVFLGVVIQLNVNTAIKSATVTLTPVTQAVQPAAVSAGFKQYQNGKPFRMLVTNQEVPVVKIMIAGFMQACSDYGLDCVLMGVNGNDIAGSVTKAEQSIALGSSGILSTIYDKAWYAPTGKAIEAGIPVINGHFPMDTDTLPGLKAWVAPDNKGYAVAAALKMAEFTACKGPVSITQSSLNDGENAVAKAFTDALVVKCPGIKVLDVQLESTDPVKAIGVTSAILQANPTLAGAFSTTGGGATAWAKGANETGKAPGAVKIIGMDYSRENLDLVNSNQVQMLVGQPLYEEMYLSTVDLLLVNMGLPVPYANVLPAPIVTKANLPAFYGINDRAEKLVIK